MIVDLKPDTAAFFRFSYKKGKFKPRYLWASSVFKLFLFSLSVYADSVNQLAERSMTVKP